MLIKFRVILKGFQWNLNFLNRFSKKDQVSIFIKIRPLGAGLFHADRWTDGQTWRSQYSLFAILRMRLKQLFEWIIELPHNKEFCALYKLSVCQEGHCACAEECLLDKYSTFKWHFVLRLLGLDTLICHKSQIVLRWRILTDYLPQWNGRCRRQRQLSVHGQHAPTRSRNHTRISSIKPQPASELIICTPPWVKKTGNIRIT